MSISLSSLLIAKPLAGLHGVPLMVLSAMSSRKHPKPLAAGEDTSPNTSPDNCQQSLLSVIEAQIIPQLMHAHPSVRDPSSVDAMVRTHRTFSAQEIEAFSESCLGPDMAQPLAYVQDLIAAGVAVESVFLDLFTPAARWLGHQWETDKKDFTAVTHGLMRMHQLTRGLGYVNPESPQKAGPVKRIFLACAPGSMHILGLSIVTEMFRSHGWQVVMEIASREQDLFTALRREWFDMIGLSVGLVEQLPGLKDLIMQLKAHALNPEALVILGGPAVDRDPDLLKNAGADGVSSDAAEAIALANRLLEDSQ